MGTHPIFESDFDCLTEMTENMERKSKQAQFFDDMNLKKKYPHYIPIEVIRARERQKQDRANQNLVKADITKLTSEIRTLHSELTLMRDLPGPATCKKLKCGHLLCLNCLQIGIDARQKEISELGKIKNLRKDKREFISHHQKVHKFDEEDPKQVCVFCRPKKASRHTAIF